jgi:hypothetical protein
MDGWFDAYSIPLGTTNSIRGPRVMCSRIRGSSWNTSTRPKPKRPVPRSSAIRWRLVVSRTRYVVFYFFISLSYHSYSLPPSQGCPREETGPHRAETRKPVWRGYRACSERRGVDELQYIRFPLNPLVRSLPSLGHSPLRPHMYMPPPQRYEHLTYVLSLLRNVFSCRAIKYERPPSSASSARPYIESRT